MFVWIDGGYRKKHTVVLKKHWTFLKKHWTFSKIPRDVFFKTTVCLKLTLRTAFFIC